MLTRIARRLVAPRTAAATILVTVALAGSALAIGTLEIDDNSIAGIDIKNGSVSSVDVANNSLTGADVRNSSLTGADVRNETLRGRDLVDDSVGGNQVEEASLGKVPTATTADNALKLGNISASEFLTRTNDTQFVSAKLAVGATKLLAQNGAVSLFATCTENGGNDIVRVVAATESNGAFLVSDIASVNGGAAPTDFLNTDTVASDRLLLQRSVADGTIEFSNTIDGGSVVSADGRYLSMNGETTSLGLNVLGSACVVAGYVARGTIA